MKITCPNCGIGVASHHNKCPDCDASIIGELQRMMQDIIDRENERMRELKAAQALVDLESSGVWQAVNMYEQNGIMPLSNHPVRMDIDAIPTIPPPAYVMGVDPYIGNPGTSQVYTTTYRVEWNQAGELNILRNGGELPSEDLPF